MKPRALSLLLCVGLSSCFFFDHPVAGGGSDQPNEIAGSLKGPGGTAMAHTQVYLYRQIDSSAISGFKQIDSTSTDSSGNYVLKADSIGAKYGIYAMKRSEALFAMKRDIRVENKNTNIDPMLLEKGATVKGTLNNSAWIQVDTLPLSLGGNSGDFSCIVPIGQKIDLFSQDSQHIPNALLAEFTAWEGDTVKVGTLNPSTNIDEILIDNFEDGNTQTLIGKYFNGGWWYGDASAGTASISSINTDAIQNGESSLALHATATVYNPDYPIRYAVLGFNLGAGENGCSNEAGTCFFDLNNAKSISFRAKGTGVVRLQLGSKVVHDLRDYNFPYVDVSLDQQWRTYTIPLSQFAISPSSPAAQKGIKMSEILKGIYAMSFLMMSDNDLWIDDVKLMGINIANLKTTH